MSIRALIVDDEPLARERISSLLADQADIEVVGECGDGRSAVAAITESSPDLVFLDVQMPEMDGFGVLAAIPREKMPVIVFVTAYDAYALRAFDVHALDYLLKPFDRQRFIDTLDRVRSQLRGRIEGGLDERLAALLSAIRPPADYVERFAVKSAGRVYFVRIDDVDYVEAAGNYLRLHVGKDEHLVRETMNSVESKLNPKRFVRIHRSVIVAIDRIKELHPWFHGEYAVVLKNGTQLTMSRGYREKLHDILGDVP